VRRVTSRKPSSLCRFARAYHFGSVAAVPMIHYLDLRSKIDYGFVCL